MKLTRYWFKFKFDEFVEIPTGVGLGCGVTAYQVSDALEIIKEKVFKGNDLPEIIAGREMLMLVL